MHDLEVFYSAMLPRMDDIADYLGSVPVAKAAEADRRLQWLACSFLEAAMAVERFREPDQLGALAPDRFRIVE
jgi:hypothetical protein